MAGIVSKIAGYILAIPVGVIEIFAPYSFEGEYKKVANKVAEDFSQAFSVNHERDGIHEELDAKSKATTYWQKQRENREDGGAK